jgi:hypothetical protein
VIGRSACLLFLLVPLLAGCGSGGNPDDLTGLGNEEGITRQIAGSWAGNLHQSGLAPFKIAVNITANGSGRVAYTVIDCGGDWDLRGTQPTTPPRYIFTETIDQGAGGTCKGTGTVTLSPIQGHSPNRPAYTRINYSFTGGGVTSRGLLRRIHAGDERPVFSKAGVTPP